MNDNPSSFGSKLELIKASDIKPKQVRWLWYPYIPFGKVTLLQGDPGDGKSKLMLSLAALLSKGAPLPFSDDEESYEPVTIIYQTTEDDADDTVVPRFNAAGGDGERLVFIKEDVKRLTFGDDRIREAVEQCDAKLLILDPMEMLRTMEAAGTVSTRGLRKDATLFDEIIIDVNTMYFERNGGYEYAKKFYEEAYHFLEKKFGSEYVVAAVMHADEINKAVTSELGKDVYHYHLHAVVIPVVDKDILWSKRCKDPALRGTVRETIHQVSHSKKWASNIPLKDEQGQPVLRSNGKPKYRPSYSILQDELVAHMQEHGFTNFQRGELGSTRENLTSLQYQIEKDKERLANIQERVEAAQTKYEAAWNVRKTESEIDDMGKKTITGKYTVSKEDYKQLTALAKEGITSRQEIHKLNEDISLYKKQYIDCKYDLRDTQSAYAALRRRSEPFLQALKYFPQFAKGFAEKIADLLEHREAQQKKEREEAKRNPHRASARRQDDQDLER